MTNPPPSANPAPRTPAANPATGGGDSAPLGKPHIHIEMLSCPRYLAGAREMVATLSRRLGFDEIGACQIALAVDEALANVIRHGYERREDQPIWMSIWEIPLVADGIEPSSPAGSRPPTANRPAPATTPATALAATPPGPAPCGLNCVTACGSGVLVTPGMATGMRIVIEDLGRQIEPSEIKGRDLDDVRPGGLGVHIIKEVMDEVVYEKRPGGGMRLTLVKRPKQGKDEAVAGPQGESNG